MNIYVMERKGTFAPSSSSTNQCKGEGHELYSYICKLLFHPDQKLDDNDFLIDHLDVDTIVTGVQYEGSCERMHIQMQKALRKEFSKRGINVVAIKTTITPVITSAVGKPIQPVASLSYTYFEDKNLLPLLN